MHPHGNCHIIIIIIVVGDPAQENVMVSWRRENLALRSFNTFLSYSPPPPPPPPPFSPPPPPQPVHKYIVQARVLRKSWPIAETAWPSIATIFHPEERTIVKPGSARKVKGKDKKKSNNNNFPSHSSPVNVPPPVNNTM